MANMRKSGVLSFDIIAFSYLLFSSLLCNIAGFDTIIKLFLALPSFLFIPYLFGKVLFEIVEKTLLNGSGDIISKFILSWWMGATLILAVGLILDFVNCFNIVLLSVIIFLVIALQLIYKLVSKKSVDSNSWKCNQSFKDVLGDGRAIFLCILIGIIPAAYYSTFLPFPQQYHLVLPHLNKVILDIINNHPYSYSSFTYSYMMTPFLLFAIPTILYNVESHFLFWALPFLFYSVFSLGLYLFAYQYSKDIRLSAMSAFIGVWIMTNNGGFQENYSVTPRAFTYVFLPFALYLILKFVIDKKDYKIKELISPFLLVGVCAFTHLFLIGLFFTETLIPPFHPKNYQIILLFTLVLLFLGFRKTLKDKSLFVFQFIFFLMLSFLIFHNFEYVLYTFVMIFYIFSYVLLKESKKRTALIHTLLIIYLLAFSFFRFLNFFGNQFSISRLIFGETYNTPDIFWVLKIFIDANTLSMVIVFLLGITLMYFSRDIKNLALVVTSSTILFIYFLPDSHAYRIGASLAPFLAYTISWVIMKVVPTRIQEVGKHFKVLRMHKNKGCWLLYTIIVLFILTPEITKPIRYFHHPYYVTDYEYKTADFISKNFDAQTLKNTVIISDPHTAAIISGLTFAESYVPRKIVENEYSSGAIFRIRYAKHQIFLAPDSKSALEAIYNLRNTPLSPKDERAGCANLTNFSNVLVVLTGRTLNWIRSQENTFLFFDSKDISVFKNIENPSFETGDLSHWTFYGSGTLKIQTDTVFDGIYAVHMSPIPKKNITMLSEEAYPCFVGQKLSLKACLKADANITHLMMGFFFYDVEGQFIAYELSDFGGAFDWSCKSIEVTVPKNAFSYRLAFLAESNINAVGNAFVDCCYHPNFYEYSLGKFCNNEYFDQIFQVEDKIYVFRVKNLLEK